MTDATPRLRADVPFADLCQPCEWKLNPRKVQIGLYLFRFLDMPPEFTEVGQEVPL